MSYSDSNEYLEKSFISKIPELPEGVFEIKRGDNKYIALKRSLISIGSEADSEDESSVSDSKQKKESKKEKLKS